jgi:hypothetical protein
VHPAISQGEQIRRIRFPHRDAIGEGSMVRAIYSSEKSKGCTPSRSGGIIREKFI